MTDDALAEIHALRERLARLEALATAPPTGDPPMPLTYEAVSHLSRTEINRRWPEVQAALAAGPTPPAPVVAADPAKPPDPAADLRREMFGAPPAPASPADPPGPAALTVGEIRKMTPDAINRDWDRVSEALKGSTR